MLLLNPTLRSTTCRFPSLVPRMTSIAATKPSTITHTTNSIYATILRKSITPQTRSLACQTLALRYPTSTATTTSTSPSSTSTSSNTQIAPLSWEAFFQLRRQRRRYNRISSILTAFIGTGIGAVFLGNREVDLLPTSIFGMDLLTLFGLAIAGCGALGWLCGPVVGGLLFRTMNRKFVKGMEAKEKEFFRHIQKNRVDPSAQSFNNPVPDYYGEKIGSLKEYRQWLKDQRAYNRKKAKFL